MSDNINKFNESKDFQFALVQHTIGYLKFVMRSILTASLLFKLGSLAVSLEPAIVIVITGESFVRY